MIELSLYFDNMTWGDLRRFVALAADEADAEAVGIAYTENAEAYALTTYLSEVPKEPL